MFPFRSSAATPRIPRTVARKIEFRLSAQADLGGPVTRAKIFGFRFSKNHGSLPSFRAGTRGVSRSSRNAVRNAVDAKMPTDERHGRGRRNRVVLARPSRAKLATMLTHRADDGGKRWFTGESAYKP